MVYPFNARHIDGTPRKRFATARKKKPEARSRRSNGKLILNGRTRAGRRLNDLISAFSIGIDMQDEEARAAVVSTARLALKAEDLGDKLDLGEGDPAVYATLVNTRDRGFARLRELRAKATAHAQPQPAGARVGPSPLALHLQEMARRKAASASGADETSSKMR
jgi:hypothetical protein